jgi:hypothetical protein
MKQVTFLFSLMLISLAGFAQGPAYTLGTTASAVYCYYSITNCNGKTVVMLRFDNRNSSAVTISWKEEFNTTLVPGSNPGYKVKQAILPPGVSEASSCTDANHNNYIIGEADVSRTYRADITGFAFSDVTITPAN